MFNFFRKKGGKAESAENADVSRTNPNSETPVNATVFPRAAPLDETDPTNPRKDVVNLLIPETDYNQKSGVTALLHNIMAGKKKRNKKKVLRTQSCRESPPKEASLQRSVSDVDAACKRDITTDANAPTPAENKTDDPADFVKALVLQKYASKPIETKKSHVSLVYVSNEPDLDEKRHAETLLREIARSIDCTIEKINDTQMGATDSKTGRKEPVYETIDEGSEEESLKSLKEDLSLELSRIQDEIKETKEDDVGKPKKSNLKPPRSDTEGCSDDDRSDGGKKKVTFRKRIVFDDGDEQTDEETDSSFESITSESESESEPENDESLGGVVVSRCENENRTIIENVNQNIEPITIKIECIDDIKASDNTDSGFIEISEVCNDSSEDLSVQSKTIVESPSESETDSVDYESGSEIEEIEEVEEEEEDELQADVQIVAEVIEPDDPRHGDFKKTLVSQESKFQNQVAALTELADARCEETEKTRDLISQYRKEIEEKDLEIERLKSELASAYKESELVRQRSRSLEEEVSAARLCSADLADQLSRKNDDSLRQLKSELESAQTRTAELESKVLALERDKDRLEQERRIQEQKALEAVAAAEENTAKWRQAHESARSQAAARAERMLGDCEWKMRELEKRARDAERQNGELTQALEQAKIENSQPSAAHKAELSQLRGLVSEQQRSVQALTLQLQRVETREEALKLEVHRLKDLLEKEAKIAKDKEERHLQTIERLENQHTKALEQAKAEHVAAAASARSALERAHAERTRAALAQLRADSEKDQRNAERKLREVTTRFENLKEELATKETQFERAINEAHSKADWELLQLRHMLDKTDITYANNFERANEKFEKEKEALIEEWSTKLKEVEDKASTAETEARLLLEGTRSKLIAERNEMINKLKEQHRQEMDEQWEQFMSDKESCLSRMKTECRQEGEEERVKREKELLEEIAELKAEIQSKSSDFDGLSLKAAACGRTLAVTEQELREALAREKELRERRSEDAGKLKQVERSSKDQIEHLQRKCACLRKLFDDIRARLAARERSAEQDSKAKDKEIAQLRGEVARLTKLLMGMGQGSPKLGARTCADGCETAAESEESVFAKTAPLASDTQPNAPRRKGGTLRTPEPIRKRPTLPELPTLPPESKMTSMKDEVGRRRAKSVDLPAVQVPGRIKQLEEKGIHA